MSTYICPMHADVRQAAAATCPKCGMALVPEGTRFALLKHMASRPWHVALMAAAMVLAMAAAMMLMR